MAVEIKECAACPTPKEQVFCGQVVVEDEFPIVPGIPKPEKVIIEPLLQTFKVELFGCDVAVVCGIIRKKIIPSECMNYKPIIHDFAFQAKIPVNINTSVPVHASDLKVTGVEVCSGCYKLLCPSMVGCRTIYRKLSEKDILAVEITYTAPNKCFDKED